MNEVMQDVDQWLSNSEAVALATVIQTWGSAPRGVGAQMALTADGKIAGSVSGGCVEGAVVETGFDVLKSGRAQLLHFGVADETAWSVGLACGGTIDVFVRPLDATQYDFLRSAVLNEQATAVVTVVQGAEDLLGRELILRGDGEVRGTLSETLDQHALVIARALMAEGQSQRVTHEAVELFVNVRLPAPELIIVGGAHIAIALTAFARTLGYRTTVIDPRKVFGSESRFAHADRLFQSWPDDAFKQVRLTRSSAVTMLTHDPKIDDPALLITLRSEAFYVGALGSRKTHAKRRERLMKQGLSAEELDRVHAPIGLEIGAQTPEEIALAIMAQIVAARQGQSENAVLADQIATMG